MALNRVIVGLAAVFLVAGIAVGGVASAPLLVVAMLLALGAAWRYRSTGLGPGELPPSQVGQGTYHGGHTHHGSGSYGGHMGGGGHIGGGGHGGH